MWQIVQNEIAIPLPCTVEEWWVTVSTIVGVEEYPADVVSCDIVGVTVEAEGFAVVVVFVLLVDGNVVVLLEVDGLVELHNVGVEYVVFV